MDCAIIVDMSGGGELTIGSYKVKVDVGEKPWTAA